MPSRNLPSRRSFAPVVGTLAKMARYFFDLFDGEVTARDEDGIEFESEAAMRDEAIKALPSMAMVELPDGDQRTFWVRVRDESGSYVFSASLDLKTDWLRSTAAAERRQVIRPHRNN